MTVLFPAINTAANTPIIAPFVVKLFKVVKLKGSYSNKIPKALEIMFAMSHLFTFS